MDALKYLKTLRRMCNGECRECEYEKRSGFDPCTVWQYDHPEEAVAIAEQWAAEHPAKTRQSVFLEQYPEAMLTEDGVLALCPMATSSEYRGENDSCVSCSRKCDDCRRKFWLAEVENAEAK